MMNRSHPPGFSVGQRVRFASSAAPHEMSRPARIIRFGRDGMAAMVLVRYEHKDREKWVDRERLVAAWTVVNIARCPFHGLHGCRDTCFAFEHEGASDCDGCDGRVEQVPMVAVADLREWIATRRAWATAGASLSERSRGHVFALEMLEKMLDVERGS